MEMEQQAADLSVDIELDRAEREKAIREQELAEMKKVQEQKISAMQSVASATGNILGALADMMESSAEGDKKAANKVKGLRIASATIDMLQGAVTAYSSAQTLGVPLGPIVGAANAAAVTAMGIANIQKIRSTQVGGSGTTAAPTVSAPRVDVGPAQTTVIRGANEEDRLNRMAADQRVYILQSDIEAAGHTSKVQVAEASF